VRSDLGAMSLLPAVVDALDGPEWPDAPMRGLKNSAVARSKQGNMPPKQLIGETVVFGRSYKMPANSAVLPTTQTRGDHEEMCLAAGASVAAVRSIDLRTRSCET
jgi:hypothetical protein